MKHKKLIAAIAALTVCSLAFAAWTLLPSNPKTDGDGDAVASQTLTSDDEGYPCPCSKFKCGECGGSLYYTAKAYKKYSGRKCSACNGRGTNSWNGDVCSYCDGEGLDWQWQPGCKCQNCGAAYEQPDC